MQERALLQKVSLPRAPTFLKLLGGRIGRIENRERLYASCSRSLMSFQVLFRKVFAGKGFGGGRLFQKAALPQET